MASAKSKLNWHSIHLNDADERIFSNLDSVSQPTIKSRIQLIFVKMVNENAYNKNCTEFYVFNNDIKPNHNKTIEKESPLTKTIPTRRTQQQQQQFKKMCIRISKRPQYCASYVIKNDCDILLLKITCAFRWNLQITMTN